MGTWNSIYDVILDVPVNKKCHSNSKKLYLSANVVASPYMHECCGLRILRVFPFPAA